MTAEDFQAVLPRVLGWIEHPVASRGFTRLPEYFSARFLASAKFVAIERPPVLPLRALGISGFEAFETMEAEGITYLDTFFVTRRSVGDESLFFHELIHVVQWRLLGPAAFLAAYAHGLQHHGYRDSPLELMAYGLQDRFDADRTPFDAEQAVANLLRPN